MEYFAEALFYVFIYKAIYNPYGTEAAQQRLTGWKAHSSLAIALQGVGWGIEARENTSIEAELQCKSDNSLLSFCRNNTKF